jgi:hypothetical protein
MVEKSLGFLPIWETVRSRRSCSVKVALGSKLTTPKDENPLERGIHATNRSRRIRRAIGLVGSGDHVGKKNKEKLYMG